MHNSGLWILIFLVVLFGMLGSIIGAAATKDDDTKVRRVGKTFLGWVIGTTLAFVSYAIFKLAQRQRGKAVATAALPPQSYSSCVENCAKMYSNPQPTQLSSLSSYSSPVGDFNYRQNQPTLQPSMFDSAAT